MELTIKELSNISKIQYPTLKTYLDNFRFDKYVSTSRVHNTRFIITNEFIDELEEYLNIKSKSTKVWLMVNDCKPIDRLRIALKNSAK